MSTPILWYGMAVLCLSSTTGVLSIKLCKDSVIDSITYVKELDMYFFTSGGHYWYISSTQFPPGESTGRLPDPFKVGQSAVYINSMDGCSSGKTSADQLVGKNAKVIWVSEVVDNHKHMLMGYDLTSGNWIPEARTYAGDKCFQPAKGVWDNKDPLDAMFSFDLLKIYMVKGKKYVRLDCTKICSDAYGDSTDPFDVTSDLLMDANTTISAMFAKGEDLYVFLPDGTFAKLGARVEPSGQVKGTTAPRDPKEKGAPKEAILKDFFKIQKPVECAAQTSHPNQPPGGDDPPPGDQHTNQGSDGDAQGSGNTTSGGGVSWIWIIVVVIVCIVVAVAFIAFLMMKKKSSSESVASAKTPKAAGAPKPAGAKKV